MNCSSSNAGGSFPSFTETKISSPLLRSPNHLLHHAPIYDYHSKSFYVYGGLHVSEVKNLTETSLGNLWKLPMPSTTWWLIKPEIAPTASISSCVTSTGSSLVLFGGKYQSGAVGNELWLYNTSFQTWTRVTHSKNPWPDARAGCSLTASTTTRKIILFGGYSNAGVSEPEVWSVTISKGRASWLQMTWPVNEQGDNKDMPSARFGHSALILKNELIIYGGRKNLTDGICFGDMWGFNIDSGIWRQIIASSRNSFTYKERIGSAADPHYCETFMLLYGSAKVVVFQNGYSIGTSTKVSNSVWMMDVTEKLQTHIMSPKRSVTVQAAGIWDGRLVYFGKYNNHARYEPEGALIALSQNCKPGLPYNVGLAMGHVKHALLDGILKSISM